MKICSLASGSCGNAYAISHRNTNILIDAGLSGKKIEQALAGVFCVSRLKGILVTHEHQDHIHGAGILSRRYKLPLYITAGTWRAGTRRLGPVADNLLNIVRAGEAFQVGDLDILPVATSHDAEEPVSYVIDSGQSKAAFLTDTGEVSGQTLNMLMSCQAVVLEANHDPEMLAQGPYPFFLKKRISGPLGHLSNLQAARVIARLLEHGKLNGFCLGHLSAENNTPQVAWQTVTAFLAAQGIKAADIPHGQILPRQAPGELLQVE
ncbi:MAG: MBL fold metallo-hydrolase [Firmicutes bacterium]|nr:MBL fold metallo-hydrolase [Bacillota bacterium]